MIDTDEFREELATLFVEMGCFLEAKQSEGARRIYANYLTTRELMFGWWTEFRRDVGRIEQEKPPGV